MKKTALFLAAWFLMCASFAQAGVTCWQEVNSTTTPTTSAMASVLGSGVTITEVSTEILGLNWHKVSASFINGESDEGSFAPSPSYYMNYQNATATLASYGSATRIYAYDKTGSATARHTYCITTNDSGSGGTGSTAAVNYIIKAS